MYIGELISLTVAISWTITALVSEVASKRMGSLPLNVVRMCMSICCLAITLFLLFGVPYPIYADCKTWFWLCLSGFVGYVLGDYCLFRSYIIIGSRFGQLFMTLAPPSAAIMAWILLGENMTWLSLLGMIVTITGIILSILGKPEGESQVKLKLPVKGILFAMGAGMGQGIGLVLSKVGMMYYTESLASYGINDLSSFIPSNVILPIPFSMSMPFASTMIRATMGILGFSVALFLFSHDGVAKFKKAITDKKGLLLVLCATMFGPFIGVSLSLMATLYTSTGIAQTIMSLSPVFIILPSYLIFHQKVTLKEVLGAIISVGGVCLFFI